MFGISYYALSGLWGPSVRGLTGLSRRTSVSGHTGLRPVLAYRALSGLNDNNSPERAQYYQGGV